MEQDRSPLVVRSMSHIISPKDPRPARCLRGVGGGHFKTEMEAITATHKVCLTKPHRARGERSASWWTDTTQVPGMESRLVGSERAAARHGHAR